MQPSVFFRCSSPDEVRISLQKIATDILNEVRPFSRETRPSGEIDLRALLELPDRDLQKSENITHLLTEACRLLAKLADRRSLSLALGISHRLYSLTYYQGRSGLASLANLYKGLAQIGLLQTDIGLKNVLVGLSGNNGLNGNEKEVPSPDWGGSQKNDRDRTILLNEDRILAFWGLTSAAIFKKNISLALKYARQWLEAAEDQGDPAEILRARMAIQVLCLILGDKKKCGSNIEAIMADPPDKWRPIAMYLHTWTHGPENDPAQPAPEIEEPFPLFLALSWHGPTAGAEGSLADEFQTLCALRRRFYQARALSEKYYLDTEIAVRYTNLVARWELSAPLMEVENLMRVNDPQGQLYFTLTRKLGKYILNKMTEPAIPGQHLDRAEKSLVLVTDIRNYSSLSEGRDPEEVFDLVNPLFKIMNEELEEVGGTIIEFAGDCLIFLFNAFKNQQSDIRRILLAVVSSVQQIAIHNVLSSQIGLPDIRVGVGIHQGPLALGYLGGLIRCHLTAIGNTVNLSSRIESATKTLPGDILVSKSCFNDLDPEIWANPMEVNFTFRDLGLHVMRNISRPVYLYGLRPLIKYLVDFVPMGFVAYPGRGIVYIDTGNSGEHGVIDHHFSEHKANSACELIIKKPELLLGHVEGVPISRIEFRLHRGPDLDCAATFYAACELLDNNPRLDILEKLASYVSLVDQGVIPHPDRLGDSLYGVLLAHRQVMEKTKGSPLEDQELLALQVRVIDAAVHLMEIGKLGGDFAFIFRFKPEWFKKERRLIEEDYRHYVEDVKYRSLCYKARVNGRKEPVTGLWLDHPQSIFFKLWARTDSKAPGGKGYAFLGVDWSGESRNRFIFSVDPESGFNLDGLGQLLEKHESEKRGKLGEQRPVHPVRYPADNADPWYFGQGHNFTIIDSPNAGTVLTGEEVRRIHENWPGSF